MIPVNIKLIFHNTSNSVNLNQTSSRSTNMRYLVGLLIFTLLISPLIAQSNQTRTVAVLDLDITGGFPESYQAPFSDRLRQELLKTDRFRVMERNNMEEIFLENNFQAEFCSSTGCAIRAGQTLGVDYMVFGSLNKVATIITINLRLIDIETKEILEAVNIDYIGSIEVVLSKKVREVARKLAGLDVAHLMINSSIENINISVNDRLFTAGDGDKFKINPGKYSLSTEMQGYHSFRTSGSLLPGEVHAIDLDIKPKTRNETIWLSAFYPGYGQRYAGNRGRGWLITLLQFASAGYGIYSWLEFQEAQDEYDKARDEYSKAFVQEDINSARRLVQKKHDNYNSAAFNANVGVAITGSIYAINLLDVIFLPGGEIRFSTINEEEN